MSKKDKAEAKARLEHKLYLARENPDELFDLTECNLQTVPKGIYSLCRVFLKTHLDLSVNALTSLSGGGKLIDLSVLQILSINHNCFTSLPEDIQLLTNLKELDVSYNQLTKLPTTICNIIKLKRLNVSHNLLKILPDNIGSLINLEAINLIGNEHLKTLPKSICKVPNLSLIELDSNDFQYPPAHIVSLGFNNILNFIRNDIGYVPTFTENVEEIERDVTDSDNKKLEDKIMVLAQNKEQKRLEFTEIDKHNREMNRQELEWANTFKLDKKKLLEDISQDQKRLDLQLDSIQQRRDAEKIKLIAHLHKAEENSNILITSLLSANKEPQAALLQQEQDECQLLLIASQNANVDICKRDVLRDMEQLLQQETQMFKEYDDYRIENFQNILKLEVSADGKLAQLLEEKYRVSDELVLKLEEDSDIQKIAVSALLERGDARSWSLLQQVKLVEAQLSTLTVIEMQRKKILMDQNLDDFVEQRNNLSAILLDLMEQQNLRRAELISILNTMEENNDNNADDFWLQQYKRLLDRMPTGLMESSKFIKLNIVESLLMAGVIHCLPFLAKYSTNEDKLLNVTRNELKNVGIYDENDIRAILDAFNICKKECDYPTSGEKLATAPPLSPIMQNQASAPSVETTLSYSTTECVICLDNACQVIFVPCGHLCTCRKCSLPVLACPMCRCVIERKILIEM